MSDSDNDNKPEEEKRPARRSGRIISFSPDEQNGTSAFANFSSKKEVTEITEVHRSVERRVRQSVVGVTQAICSLCKLVLRDPVTIGCYHSFCQQCLETLCTEKDKLPGDRIECPDCQTEFEIPPAGILALRQNEFMHRRSEQVGCDECSLDHAAVNYCVTCSKKLCKDCTRKHRDERRTSTHVIDKTGARLEQHIQRISIRQIKSTFCEIHRQDGMKFYCFTCGTVINCGICFEDKHSDHNWREATRVAEELKVDMSKEEERVIRRMQFMKTMIETYVKLQRDSKSSSEIVQSINWKRNEMKKLVNDHANRLLREVEKSKKKAMSEISIRSTVTKQTVVALETFVAYSSQIRSKGSSSDVAVNFTELQSRSEELLKVDVRSNEVDTPKIRFEPVNVNKILRDILGNNLVGYVYNEGPTDRRRD